MKYSAEDYNEALKEESGLVSEYERMDLRGASRHADICASALKLAASIAEIPVSDRETLLKDWNDDNLVTADFDIITKILTASLGE